MKKDGRTHIGLDEIFSMDEMLANLNGDRELVRTVITMSSNQFPTSMADIREAIDEGNGFKLLRSAHKLRGMAGNLRAFGVMETAAQLELMGANSDLDHAAEKFVELCSEIGRLRLALDQFSHDL